MKKKKKKMIDKDPVYKFLCLKSNEYLPQKSTELDTGYDVKACLDKSIVLDNKGVYFINLGIKAFCPEGWWLELRPRSSSFAKKNLDSLYGVIDEGYEGELLYCCRYTGESPLIINDKDKIGQLIPVKRVNMVVKEVTKEEYEMLSSNRKNNRKEGGFGSTGV